jgi:hypothetical protein
MALSVVGVDIFDWIERNSAQVWPTRTKGQITGWTVQVIARSGTIIQPTRASLLAALADAIKQLEEFKARNRQTLELNFLW